MVVNAFMTAYNGAILGPIARLLGYILQGLYQALSVIGIENTGICMILFTFLVNLLMMPMQIKQQKFAKMSSVMNPELMAIQEKYKGKKDAASQQKMSLETQAVYQRYGVSPVSGCLPMLITFPILFALYRVIYNVPAYVPQVYDIYEKLAVSLHSAGISVDQLAGKAYINTPTYVVTQAVKAAASDKDNIHYYVDVLSQYGTQGWSVLANKYNQYSDVILSTARKAKDINYFLGLNIADTPKLQSISIIIPILSIITQFISTKLSMAGNPQSQQMSDNPMAQSMNSMTNVMPFVSGAMCLMFPIGVGIYWIAGNVFRIFQSLLLNAYFAKVDVDDMIQKNVEKAKKKYEKMGMDTSLLEKAAKTRTSQIDVNENKRKQQNKSVDSKKAPDKNSISAKAQSVASVKESNGSTKKKGKFKEGSIAAYANMLNQDRDS